MVSDVTLDAVLGPRRTAALPFSALRRLSAGDLAVPALLAWWVTRMTWDGGGRDAHIGTVGAVLALVALVAVRPDRTLAWPQLVLPTWLAAAAWLVVVIAPTGWGGADDAASYTLAAATFLVVAAWAVDDTRRLFVVVAVLMAAGAEFAQAWLPWWGKQDPSAQMFGTFYWWNQYAVFLLPGVVLGAWCLAGARVRAVRILGWVVMPLAAAGIALSASRAGETAAVLGVMALACGFAVVRRWRQLLRVIAGVAASLAAIWLLQGPPFFSHRAAIGASTVARATTLSSSGGYRLDDWRRAVEIFFHWPVSGAGFHSYLAAGAVVDPTDRANVTAFAHSGFLQAFSDGGVLLGLPFALGLLLVAALGVRTVWRDLRSRRFGPASAMSVSFVLLLLHSAMDFDWSYPSLLTLAALSAGWVVSASREPVAAVRPPADAVGTPTVIGTVARRVAFVAVALALLVAAVGAWHGTYRLHLPIGPGPVTAAPTGVAG